MTAEERKFVAKMVVLEPITKRFTARQHRSTSLQQTASACSSSLRSTCLLQVQRISTKKGWVNVMWDSGASLSFITNSKAKEENLRGNKVELSIVKVGARWRKLSPRSTC